jgi:hypothetical protein
MKLTTACMRLLCKKNRKIIYVFHSKLQPHTWTPLARLRRRPFITAPILLEAPLLLATPLLFVASTLFFRLTKYIYKKIDIFTFSFLFFESRCSQSTFLTGWGKIYSCIILIQGVIEVFKAPCGPPGC